jgi:hypothetical protein
MENNTNRMCLVKNRSASRIVYRIPELGIRREFSPTETKKIAYEELEKLSYQPGGVAMMTNFLQIQDAPATNDLGIHVEPEYHMSEQQIVELIKIGSLDAFLDCLDFAPVGVIDLVKKFAVSVPLADYDKRQALKEKTGFDVDAALKNIAAEKAEEEAKKNTNTSRRIQPVEEAPATAGRRTTGSNYKVTSRAEAQISAE